jgi:hypothetical protein
VREGCGAMKLDIAAIEQQFWPRGSNRDVYMILDGARDRRIYSDLMNSHLIYSCLYSGDLPLELEVAAPHLVQLEFEDKFTRNLIEKSWGKSWGVFLKSDTRMERLRRHLRTFLRVKSWRGQNLVFRYYDPRILRVYLPTCTGDELQTVFGPIQQFCTENEDADALTQFSFLRGKLTRETICVTDEGVSANAS